MLNVQPLNHFKYKETEYGYVGHEASEFSITSETKTFFNKFKVSLLKFWSYYISLRNYENIDGKVLIEENGKKKDIKTLYKIGANTAQVSSVFFKHGFANGRTSIEAMPSVLAGLPIHTASSAKRTCKLSLSAVL